jgi:hypothetical protein
VRCYDHRRETGVLVTGFCKANDVFVLMSWCESVAKLQAFVVQTDETNL